MSGTVTEKLKSAMNSLNKHIIKEFYYKGPLSCAELSGLLHKSIPLVTKGLNELVKEGFIVEQGYAPSSGGRRPLLYNLQSDKMYILCVAMDQLSTRINIVNLSNEQVSEPVMIRLPLRDNPEALQLLIDSIKEYIKATNISPDKIIGAGIGMPGLVNTKEGINYTYLPIADESLEDYLTKALGISTYIDNDSSLIALAELRFGMAKAKKEVMVINVSWGIGLGMILNGELFRGHNGFAGEFSHIPISKDGKLCNCGKQGCLEAEASMLAVAEKAIEEIRQGKITSLQDVIKDNTHIAMHAIMEAANKGDQYAIELLSEAGYKIGRGLAILIHILNPERIVLSGTGARVGRILLAPVQQALNKYCIPRLATNTELLISELGYDGELIGAAVLVMDNLDKKGKVKSQPLIKS